MHRHCQRDCPAAEQVDKALAGIAAAVVTMITTEHFAPSVGLPPGRSCPQHYRYRRCGPPLTQAGARPCLRCRCGSAPMSSPCGWASCTATPPRWRVGASRRSTCARRVTAPRSRAGWRAQVWTPSPAPTPACRCSRRCLDRKAGTRAGSSTMAPLACPTSGAMLLDFYTHRRRAVRPGAQAFRRGSRRRRGGRGHGHRHRPATLALLCRPSGPLAAMPVCPTLIASFAGPSPRLPMRSDPWSQSDARHRGRHRPL
jgi:hypothetical protein